MAQASLKFTIESARAAALASHCAAGLATAARYRSAARLLRAAEALARSAVAELGFPAPQPASAASAAVPGGTGEPSKRAVRRRAKKEKGKMGAAAMSVELVQSVAVSGGVSEAALPPAVQPSLVSAGAGPGTVRTLRARISRERSPRRSRPPSASSASAPAGSATGSASIGRLAVGQTALLGGLESRPELTGSVTILSFDSLAGRYAVTVDATGEKFKVKGANLKALPL